VIQSVSIAASAATLAIAYLYGAAQIPRLSVGDPLGPKVFPIMLGCALLVGAGMLLLELRGAQRPTTAERDVPPSTVAVASRLPILALLGWTLLYFVLFETLGYLISTFTYLLVLTSVLNRGAHLLNATTTAAFTLGSYVFFTRVLEARLPRGLLDL
jgi:putative tricarboxylic transport membrane protein